MPLPETVYASFSGPIDQQSISRIFQNLAGATQGGVRVVHVLFQSTGGSINDGVALYNYLRTYSLELHFYNTGAVQSIAAVAWLGVAHRHVSQHGRFMLHHSSNPGLPGGNAAKYQAIVDSLVADDARTTAIVKTHTHIPDERWALHATQDLSFNAQEAVDFDIAHDIREFEVPAGNQIFNI